MSDKNKLILASKMEERIFLVNFMGERTFAKQSDIEKQRELGFHIDVLKEMLPNEIKALKELGKIK